MLLEEVANPLLLIGGDSGVLPSRKAMKTECKVAGNLWVSRTVPSLCLLACGGNDTTLFSLPKCPSLEDEQEPPCLKKLLHWPTQA